MWVQHLLYGLYAIYGIYRLYSIYGIYGSDRSDSIDGVTVSTVRYSIYSIYTSPLASARPAKQRSDRRGPGTAQLRVHVTLVPSSTSPTSLSSYLACFYPTTSMHAKRARLYLPS